MKNKPTPNNITPIQALPTKDGPIYITPRPFKHDLSWVAVNNVSVKQGA